MRLPTRFPALALACAAAVSATACSGARGTAAPVVSPGPPYATTTAASPPPTSTSSAAPTHRPRHPITLAFGGDVHFMGVDAVRLAADPASAIGPAAGVLRSADLAMVNLETAVTTRGTPAAKQYVFRAPASTFTALRAAGVDVVTMANNHGMDYGAVGLQDSLAAAKAARFPVLGIGADAAQAFASYRTVVRGERVEIVAATQVLDDNLAAAWTAGPGKPGLASAKDPARLLAAVRTARDRADTVVVYLHWGRELQDCPTDDQRTLEAQLVAAGADVVVGSHAHVLLGGGYDGRAYVDYGLGNFVFYSGSGRTAASGVLKLTVLGHHVQHAAWHPMQVSAGVAVPLAGSAATDATARWTQLRGCTGLTASPAG